MHTQIRQPVPISPLPTPREHRHARRRTLIEAIVAIYIVAILTGYALIQVLQSQFANRLDPFLTELPLAASRSRIRSA